MIADYFRMALRSVARRRLRSWLTLVGIVIGITSVVALIGLGEGLRTAITGQFGMLGTDILTIQVNGGFGAPGTGVLEPLTSDNLDEIRKINGVKQAAARLISTGKLEFNKVVAFGYAASVPQGDGRDLFIEQTGLEADRGRILKDSEKGKVNIGYNLGQESMADFFGKPITLGSRVDIQDRPYEVVGVLEKQGSFLFDNIILMNEDDLRVAFNRDPDVYDIMVVQVQNTDNIADVQADVERYLRKDRGLKEGEEDFTVQTAQSALEQINSVLFAVQLFVYIIAGISIVVGGFGVMNTMFTSVLERTRDIGIMKSIGAKNSNIFMLFFIESGLIGSVGGIIGALFGAMLAIGLAYLGAANLGEDLIRAHISPMLIIGSISGSFLLGSIFGIIPAVQASRLHPVDALRHAK